MAIIFCAVSIKMIYQNVSTMILELLRTVDFFFAVSFLAGRLQAALQSSLPRLRLFGYTHFAERFVPYGDRTRKEEKKQKQKQKKNSKKKTSQKIVYFVIKYRSSLKSKLRSS